MSRSHEIRLVAICFCIAFGITAHVSSPNPPPGNSPPGKMQDKYVAKIVEIDYKNFVDSLESWLNSKEKTKNQYIFQHMQKLQDSINSNSDNLARWLGKLQDSVNDNAARFAILESAVKTNLDVLRTKLSWLNRIGQELNTFTEQVRKELAQQVQENERVKHEVEDMKEDMKHQKTSLLKMRNEVASCVTDIRVSPSEEYRRRDSYLSPEKMRKATTDAGDKGYFLTAVSTLNTNSNSFGIKRRAISFRKKNNWHSLHA